MASVESLTHLCIGTAASADCVALAYGFFTWAIQGLVLFDNEFRDK
jgi:hypothetical protein